MLKEGKEMFLDGYTVNDLARALQSKVKHVSNLKELIDDLLAQ
jgi:NifB/MoaA-like Fe-S oxidoreductase